MSRRRTPTDPEGGMVRSSSPTQVGAAERGELELPQETTLRGLADHVA